MCDELSNVYTNNRNLPDVFADGRDVFFVAGSVGWIAGHIEDESKDSSLTFLLVSPSDDGCLRGLRDAGKEMGG